MYLTVINACKCTEQCGMNRDEGQMFLKWNWIVMVSERGWGREVEEGRRGGWRCRRRQRIRSKQEQMREGIRSWRRQEEEERHFQVDWWSVRKTRVQHPRRDDRRRERQKRWRRSAEVWEERETNPPEDRRRRKDESSGLKEDVTSKSRERIIYFKWKTGRILWINRVNKLKLNRDRLHLLFSSSPPNGS